MWLESRTSKQPVRFCAANRAGVCGARECVGDAVTRQSGTPGHTKSSDRRAEERLLLPLWDSAGAGGWKDARPVCRGLQTRPVPPALTTAWEHPQLLRNVLHMLTRCLADP